MLLAKDRPLGRLFALRDPHLLEFVDERCPDVFDRFDRTFWRHLGAGVGAAAAALLSCEDEFMKTSTHKTF